MSKSDKFFNETEKARIHDTIHQIELRSIGEVAVMVVDSSAQYAEAEVLGSLISGSFISLILTVIFFHSSVWVYIPLSFLFLFLLLPIFIKIPLLKTPFISLKRRDIAVRERAVRAFYEKGLYKTKKNTGVLIIISLLEHKVWILADKGIYEKIEQEILNNFAKTISQGVKDKKACDSLCNVMQDIGNVLAANFPVTHDDINELSNEVITE